MSKSRLTYFIYSKNIITSLIFIFPFIILYEGISFFYFRNLNYEIRNSADVILRNFFDIFGYYSNHIHNLLGNISYYLCFFSCDIDNIRRKFI